MKKMIFKKMIRGVLSKRLLLLFGVLFVFAGVALAGNISAGQGALNSVNSEIRAWFPIVKNLMYGLAGLIGLFGGIGVYNKMNNDDQDVKKSIMMVVGGCLFIIVLAESLSKFFSL